MNNVKLPRKDRPIHVETIRLGDFNLDAIKKGGSFSTGFRVKGKLIIVQIEKAEEDQL